MTWLFVSRNFKEDHKDLEALRTHERFGISSWPQMIVFDPIDDTVLLDPPRDLPGFIRAFERAKEKIASRAPGEGMTDAHRLMVDPPASDPRPPSERLKDPNPIVRAIALEELAKAKVLDEEVLRQAQALLVAKEEDLVVFLRAVRLVARTRPQVVLDNAESLLAIDNDPLRYEILELLKAHPKSDLAPLLNRIFAEAGAAVPSRNPNVLRLRTAPCLGKSGDASSIDAMAPLALAANWRNGTTRVVIQNLAELAVRLPAERARIDKVLMDSFPKAVSADDAREIRARLSLATSVRDALASTRAEFKPPAMPETWDEEARQAFLSKLGAD